MTTSARQPAPKLVADSAAWSLPAWTYSDPDFMALEREKVFMPAWHLVCHESDIPAIGDYATFKMFGEIAFVVRGKEGEVRAFHNVCRHRAARLVDGHQGNCGRNIVCPYHAWTYQLDGRLSGVPYLEQYEHFEKSEHGLTPVECASFGGFIFIRFRKGGPALDAYMAPLTEELSIYKTADMKPLRKIGERVREVNWKNATDNYCDALHIPVAHWGLNDLIGPTYRLTVDRGVFKIFGDLESGRSPSRSNAAYKAALPYVEHLPAERQRLWTYYKLWPNLMFDVYPDQVDFMQFIPLTATSCILRESAYALPDDRRAMKAARYLNCRINRDVNLEDKDLIERVQAGMASSSFRTGPLGREEVCLRHFANQMRETIPLARHAARPAHGIMEAALQEREFQQ